MDIHSSGNRQPEICFRHSFYCCYAASLHHAGVKLAPIVCWWQETQRWNLLNHTSKKLGEGECEKFTDQGTNLLSSWNTQQYTMDPLPLSYLGQSWFQIICWNIHRYKRDAATGILFPQDGRPISERGIWAVWGSNLGSNNATLD